MPRPSKEPRMKAGHDSLVRPTATSPIVDGEPFSGAIKLLAEEQDRAQSRFPVRGSSIGACPRQLALGAVVHKLGSAEPTANAPGKFGRLKHPKFNLLRNHVAAGYISRQMPTNTLSGFQLGHAVERFVYESALAGFRKDLELLHESAPTTAWGCINTVTRNGSPLNATDRHAMRGFVHIKNVTYNGREFRYYASYATTVSGTYPPPLIVAVTVAETVSDFADATRDLDDAFVPICAGDLADRADELMDDGVLLDHSTLLEEAKRSNSSDMRQRVLNAQPRYLSFAVLRPVSQHETWFPVPGIRWDPQTETPESLRVSSDGTVLVRARADIVCGFSLKGARDIGTGTRIRRNYAPPLEHLAIGNHVADVSVMEVKSVNSFAFSKLSKGEEVRADHIAQVSAQASGLCMELAVSCGGSIAVSPQILYVNRDTGETACIHSAASGLHRIVSGAIGILTSKPHQFCSVSRLAMDLYEAVSFGREDLKFFPNTSQWIAHRRVSRKAVGNSTSVITAPDATDTTEMSYHNLLSVNGPLAKIARSAALSLSTASEAWRIGTLDAVSQVEPKPIMEVLEHRKDHGKSSDGPVPWQCNYCPFGPIVAGCGEHLGLSIEEPKSRSKSGVPSFKIVPGFTT